MFVDLSDFRVISAVRVGPAGREGVNILISSAVRAGLVHIVHVVEDTNADPVTLVVPETSGAAAVFSPAIATGDSDALARALEAHGHVVLQGLTFETGSARLDAGEVPVLVALAAYLSDHPDARVTLVGHTDSEGGLDKNMTLSKRRAEAVRDYMVQELGVGAGQLDADGVSYLAPVTTNATPEGREQNRRVEAILLTAD
nr:OmpA family protein [Shimia biformata]